jgi:hypothetical protein
MAIATPSRSPQTHPPARPRLVTPSAGSRFTAVLAVLRRTGVWYAAFAIYAGAVAAFSGPGNDRWWGIWAAGGYAVAALAALCWGSRGSAVAVIVSLAGALAAPLAWIATHGPATSDTQVVTRSATLLTEHGTPYLPVADLTGWIAYNPYLPVMSLFGLPHALGLTGLAGTTGVWLGLVTLGLFGLAFRVAGRRDALRLGAFVTATPVVAFPLALGITDPPVLALLCLALALLGRAMHKPTGRAVLAASVTVGVACAMKYTAWPALPVLAALLAYRDGFRAAGRFVAGAVGTAAALIAVCAPAALAHPAALVQNTLAYPLGLTHAKSPAQSPLPGHLLASLGPAGHDTAVALLVLSGLAVAVSLMVRPPASIQSATLLVALSLALMFALSPATRFGYFAYPIGLCGWVALTGRRSASSGGSDRHLTAWRFDQPVADVHAPPQPTAYPELLLTAIAEPDHQPVIHGVAVPPALLSGDDAFPGIVLAYPAPEHNASPQLAGRF